jgi:broad specificity phosphatase PhoE
MVVGPGQLIDPTRVVKAFISPRQRAQKTFSLLTEELEGVSVDKETTEELREWEYGLYEGLLTKQIRAARKERGLDQSREWDIWTDGCEEGELVLLYFQLRSEELTSFTSDYRNKLAIVWTL